MQNGASCYSGTIIASEDPTANGILAVFVATELTTPNSTVNNDIQINVFISTCDDIDYSEPTSTQIGSLTYSTQAEDDISPDESAPVKEVGDEKAMECLVTDNAHDVYFGETYSSFRNLLKRYAYHGSILCPTAGDNIWSLTLHNYPYYRGRVPGAQNVDSTAAACNLVPTCLLTYLTPAYLAVRGSIRWKYLYSSDKDSNLSYSKVSRIDAPGASQINATTVPVVTNGNTFMVSRGTPEVNGYEGMDVTFNKAQPVTEFEVPFYSNLRFMVAKLFGGSAFGVQNDRHRYTVDNHSTTVAYIDRYVSTGEDFSLVLFQGAPPVKRFTLAAT